MSKIDLNANDPQDHEFQEDVSEEQDDQDGSSQQDAQEKRKWLMVCVTIVAVGALLLFLLTILKDEPEVQERTTSTPSVDAQRLTVRSEQILLTGSGRVSPIAQVRLQSQVSGDVVFVSEQLKSGGRFAKNDLLLTVNPLGFKARVDEAKAQVESARSELQLAEQQFARSEKLAGVKATSQQEVEQRRAALAAAKARILQASAALTTAKLDLSRTQITAPFDGKVVSENVSIGDVLSPGFVFADIYSTEAFEVPISLPISDAVLLGDIFESNSKGEKNTKPIAIVQADFANHRYSWNAYIDRVEVGLDDATRTVNVVVRIDNPEQRGKPLSDSQQSFITPPPLLNNMFVEAALPSVVIENLISVGRDAIRADGSLWVVATNGSSMGEVQVLQGNWLAAHGGTAYLQVSQFPDGQVYALGSDIGGVLPGNTVRIRQLEAQLNTSATDNSLEESAHATIGANQEADGSTQPQIKASQTSAPVVNTTDGASR